MKSAAVRVAVLLALLGAAGLASAATFSVVNVDAGTGAFSLNDPTPFTPVGGNNATTLGQARLNVITEAARIWGQRIGSTQTIVVEAQMAAKPCTSTAATLASGGPKTFFIQNSAPNVLLPAALADALTDSNNNNRNDIVLTVSSTVGSTPSCLNGRTFYLGFDHANGTNVDLLSVLLHELGHGLGFLSLTDIAGTSPVAGKFTAFEQFAYSERLGRFWPAMSDAERASASVDTGRLVYNGPAVNVNLTGYTSSTGLSSPGAHLRLYAPATYDDGSSVSHWDPVAFPNLLMEPNITANPQGLTDLTGCVLQDMGWPAARCPDLAVAANTPPVALAQTVEVAGDTPTPITLRGIDPDSTILTYTIVSPPTRGTLVAPVSLSDGTGGGVVFFYTAATNATATDSFTFRVSDGQAFSSSARVTLNISRANRAPVANPQTVTVQSGQSVNITLTGSDVDGDALGFTVTSSPVGGTLSGVAPNLVYTARTGFSGPDGFQFVASDGLAGSVPATVTIQVTPPPAPASSGSGGGGGIDPVSLALLLMFWLVHSSAPAAGAHRFGAFWLYNLPCSRSCP